MSPGPKEPPRLRPQGKFFSGKADWGSGSEDALQMQPETTMDSSLARSSLSWFQGKLVNMESNQE